MLASYCMVAGKDFNGQVENYLANIWRNPNAISREQHQARMEQYFRRLGATWVTIPRGFPTGQEARLHVTRADLNGKGIIIVASLGTSTKHALAYENGTIYNPALDGAAMNYQQFQEYLERYRYMVESIMPYEEKTDA